MKRFGLGFFPAAVLVASFAACSKKSDESSSTTTTTTSTEATASPVAEASVTPEVSSPESPSAAPSVSPSIAGLVVAFTDIEGDFGEQQIKDDGAGYPGSRTRAWPIAAKPASLPCKNGAL